MYLSAVVWLVSLFVLAQVDRPGLPPAVLGLTTACALVLAVEQVLRRRRGRRLPAGDAIAPQPSVPVTGRFRRTARLVLVPAGGPVESLVVRDTAHHQLWLDGPASPLGVQRALVVTPPGADRPERVDLVDGLGRAVVRLPWDQWFGGAPEQLSVPERRGIPVEPTVRPSLGPAAEMLLLPRSARFALSTFRPPGGLGAIRDGQLAIGVTVLPIAVVVGGYESTATLLLGLLNGALLLGPVLARALARWLDAPR